MNRAQFFSEVCGRTVSALEKMVLVSAFTTMIFRLINTEYVVKIAAFLAIPMAIAWLVMIAKLFSHMFALHRHEHEGKGGYVEPSIFSIKLLPQSFILCIGTIVPPVLITSLVFGLNNHEHKHTEILSILFLFQFLVLWFYWVFDPLIKKVLRSEEKL
ncbi:hypothetical protein [uncultured Microbulbifer sp.]|uniref:hypothetical protein n=1 Tax=uncultured Microbulbifer sp. TaxID=348147 RepID=UPI0026385259|nr:hypothetical protein [uncultured Microbulbifer sp.]